MQGTHLPGETIALHAGVVVGTACTASLYKQQTKAVERSNSEALGRMSSVASQAFSGIRTVRCVCTRT